MFSTKQPMATVKEPKLHQGQNGEKPEPPGHERTDYYLTHLNSTLFILHH